MEALTVTDSIVCHICFDAWHVEENEIARHYKNKHYRKGAKHGIKTFQNSKSEWTLRMPYDRLRIVPERVAKDIMKKLHFDDLKRRQFTGVAKENKAPDADLPYLRKIYEEHGMPPPNDLSPIVRPTGPAEGSYVRVKAARAARAKAAAVKAARAEAAAAEADEANKDEEMVDADEDNEADEMDVDDKKVEDSEVLPSRDEESD